MFQIQNKVILEPLSEKSDRIILFGPGVIGNN